MVVFMHRNMILTVRKHLSIQNYKKLTGSCGVVAGNVSWLMIVACHWLSSFNRLTKGTQCLMF